jgi:hypothetical protein
MEKVLFVYSQQLLLLRPEMKTQRFRPSPSLVLGLIITGLLALAGCAQDGPVAPTTANDPDGPSACLHRATCTSTATTTGIRLPGSTSIGPTTTGPVSTSSYGTTDDGNSVTSVAAIVWPVPNQPRTDVLSDSVYVTPMSGGTVKVRWSNWDPYHNRLSTVSFTLMIPCGAVSSPKMISVTVDKSNPAITAEFGPSGTVFRKPALLDVQASGLDLRGFRATDHIDLWYVNSTGWVGTMQYGDFRFDPTRGTLAVTNLQIPHFSRYCFGR